MNRRIFNINFVQRAFLKSYFCLGQYIYSLLKWLKSHRCITSGVSRDQKMVAQHFEGGFRHEFGSWPSASWWDPKSRRVWVWELKSQKDFTTAAPLFEKQSTSRGRWKTSASVPSSGQSARSPWGQTWKCVHVESETAHIYVSSSLRETAEVETRPCNMNHEPKPTADNLDLARRMKKLVSVALNLRQFWIRE